MDDRLSLSVEHADGRVTRWGPDELEPGDIPSDLEFSTSMPGGHRDLSCSLLRRIDLEYPDQALFDDVTAYGPGGRVAWNGRFTQFPRSHGSGFSVTPGAVGWAAHLRDDPSFLEIYRDIDLSHWGQVGTGRRTTVMGGSRSFFDVAQIQDTTTGLPAIETKMTSEWLASSTSEALYDAQGIDIGKVYYAFATSANVNPADASWSWSVGVAAGDDLNTATSTGDLSAATTGSGTYTPATVQPYAYLQQSYSAAVTAGPGTMFSIYWRSLAVYGNHGLTLQGTEPDGGFLASDIVADIVTRAAPLLSTSGVEASDFTIPHCVFLDPVTAEDAISLVNGYHLWEWGVYDNKVFFYRPPDPNRLVWEARLDRGAFLDLEGDTGEQVYNGVYVSYQDGAGVKKTIGPTGATADATSTLLEDTSPSNPVNAHGIPRRWARLEISQPTTQLGAEQLGYVWLVEHSLPQRRGNLTVTGGITHPTRGEVPAWEPRAGDSVRITDGGVSDTPRRIISTSYSHGSRSVNLSLDNTSLKLDAILERMGVGLVGVL